MFVDDGMPPFHVIVCAGLLLQSAQVEVPHFRQVTCGLFASAFDKVLLKIQDQHLPAQSRSEEPAQLCSGDAKIG